MADRPIDTKYGAIEVKVDLATAKEGNQALAAAQDAAKAEASREGRKLRPGYGTRRDGNVLTIIFAYDDAK